MLISMTSLHCTLTQQNRISMDEADRTVSDLVADLLSDLTRLVEPIYCNPTESICDSCSECELASLVRHCLPESITNNFSLRSSRIEVFQVKCVDQRASGEAGELNCSRAQCLISITCSNSYFRLLWSLCCVLCSQDARGVQMSV